MLPGPAQPGLTGCGLLGRTRLGGALVVIGFVTFLIGLVADLINFNRQLIEMTLEKMRRMELAPKNDEARRNEP